MGRLKTAERHAYTLKNPPPELLNFAYRDPIKLAEKIGHPSPEHSPYPAATLPQ